MSAVYEFERDCIVHRLHAGLQAAKAKSTRRTQGGDVKVNGRLSTLERLQPTSARLRCMHALTKKQSRGKLSYRQLAERFSKVLKLRTPMSMETARRISTSM